LNELNYVDFQYYRVRIQAFPSQPHLVGREALLQHHDANIFLSASPTVGTGVQKFGAEIKGG